MNNNARGSMWRGLGTHSSGRSAAWDGPTGRSHRLLPMGRCSARLLAARTDRGTSTGEEGICCRLNRLHSAQARFGLGNGAGRRPGRAGWWPELAGLRPQTMSGSDEQFKPVYT